MPRLIWVFAGRSLILLVLSCRGSFPDCSAVNYLGFPPPQRQSIKSVFRSRNVLCDVDSISKYIALVINFMFYTIKGPSLSHVIITNVKGCHQMIWLFVHTVGNWPVNMCVSNRSVLVDTSDQMASRTAYSSILKYFQNATLASMYEV